MENNNNRNSYYNNNNNISNNYNNSSNSNSGFIRELPDSDANKYSGIKYIGCGTNRSSNIPFNNANGPFSYFYNSYVPNDNFNHTFNSFNNNCTCSSSNNLFKGKVYAESTTLTNFIKDMFGIIIKNLGENAAFVENIQEIWIYHRMFNKRINRDSDSIIIKSDIPEVSNILYGIFKTLSSIIPETIANIDRVKIHSKNKKNYSGDNSNGNNKKRQREDGCDNDQERKQIKLEQQQQLSILTQLTQLITKSPPNLLNNIENFTPTPTPTKISSDLPNNIGAIIQNLTPQHPTHEPISQQPTSTIPQSVSQQQLISSTTQEESAQPQEQPLKESAQPQEQPLKESNSHKMEQVQAQVQELKQRQKQRKPSTTNRRSSVSKKNKINDVSSSPSNNQQQL